MACEPHKNPLQRSGTSQADRRLPGLSPDYVRIDERRYSDWIVFAAEFSRWLRFYDSGSGASLNGWQAFFTRDVSAVLGGFAVQNIETWRLGVRERLDYLRDDDHAADDAGLRKRMGEVVGGVFTLAKALDDFYLQLPEDLPFKATLRKFIKVRLAPAFRRLIGYYKSALALNLGTTASHPAWKILNRPLSDAGLIFADPAAFTAEWWDPASGQGSYAAIPADPSVFGDAGSVYARVSHAANHFLFSSIFDQFTEAYARLIADAEAGLLESLESIDSHKPHYALFLTFLRLFRTSQSQMNGLLWRHLDHYYKDILRLKPKGPEPDHVHLVAELAKAVTAASLPKGALFKAGKDSLGKDVLYALDEETTFNKGEVAEFKSVYRVDPADLWQDSVLAASQRYFAAPIMNSADGLGGKLLTASQEWHPFLNRTTAVDGTITAVNMPAARVGFALASHYLFLAEGTRNIRLRLGGNGFAAFPKEKLVCYLTHEKGWLEKAPHAIAQATFSGGGGVCTEIEIRLDGTEPALIAWNAKVHGGAFNVDLPVVQVILRNDAAGTYGLDGLKNIAVTSAEVHVRVGAVSNVFSDAGAKQVLAGNAGGSLDPSKPFMPWGALPKKDAPFVLGNSEAFTKRHAALNLHIEWANRPATVTPSPTARLQFLEGGAWRDAEAAFAGGKACSSSRQRTFTSDVALPDAAVADFRDGYADYNPASKNGFLRLILNGDFGQEAYQEALTAYLIGQAAAAANPAVPPGTSSEVATGIVHDIIQGIGGTVEQVADTVGNTVGDAVGTVVGGVAETADAVGEFVGDAVDAIGNAVEDAVEAVGNAAEDAAEDVADFFNDVGNAIGGMFKSTAAPAQAQSAPGIKSIQTGQLSQVEGLDKTIGKAVLKAMGPVKPYLPLIGSLYLSYSAGSRAVDLTATWEEPADRAVRFFHVGPFWEAEQEYPIPGASGHFLIPQFRFPEGEDHIGEWMIGIRNLAPRQSVEVLIQVLEGSTLPTLSKPQNHVTWSYWAGSGWIPFEDRDFNDGTKQLIQSGIVRFTIPHDAATDKGAMPPGFIWVMASVTEAVGAVCKILSAQAQALQATLVLSGVAPDYLDAPLPAGSISKLKEADSRFKKFSQPHPSFGGRQTETSDRFYQRSSERLRHKGRAATLWDYESLVLEAFPNVYKVKCLSHTRIEDNPDASLAIHNENAPGHVALIAIPSLVNRSDSNPLKPFASQDLLSGIKDFLKERVTGQLVPSPTAPVQVNVHVCNPLFEEIYLAFDLQLRDGYEDFSWYRQVLQEEITRHLSPWAFAAPEAGSDAVQFGGRISKSSLINFIEERPYVDFITSVVLKHKPGNQPVSGDLEEAVATTSRSILVSAPALDHAITQYGTP